MDLDKKWSNKELVELGRQRLNELREERERNIFRAMMYGVKGDKNVTKANNGFEIEKR